MKTVTIVYVLLFIFFPSVRLVTADSLNTVANVIYSTTR